MDDLIAFGLAVHHPKSIRTQIPRRNDFAIFSPKLGEDVGETLLSLALFCHSAYISANNFSKPNFLKHFHRPD